MGAGHHHHHHHGIGPGLAAQRSLKIALALTSVFLLVELGAAWWFNSLALYADAAHMFTDVAALAIALAAAHWSLRPADRRRTFGYQRLEVLAAVVNALLLLGAAAVILFEAWQRFRSPESVQVAGMFAVAAAGLVVNLIALRLLSPERDSNLSVKGAYLEVLSDALASAGILFGAAVMYFTRWTWLDPLIGAAIALWVLPRSWVLLRECLNILLEGVPDGVDLAGIETALLAAPGVLGVHSLHVWSLGTGSHRLAVHVVHDPQVPAAGVVQTLTDLLSHRFSIAESTVQCECEPLTCGAMARAQGDTGPLN